MMFKNHKKLPFKLCIETTNKTLPFTKKCNWVLWELKINIQLGSFTPLTTMKSCFSKNIRIPKFKEIIPGFPGGCMQQTLGILSYANDHHNLSLDYWEYMGMEIQTSQFLKGTWTSKIILGKLKYICLGFQKCNFFTNSSTYMSIEITKKMW